MAFSWPNWYCYFKLVGFLARGILISRVLKCLVKTRRQKLVDGYQRHLVKVHPAKGYLTKYPLADIHACMYNKNKKTIKQTLEEQCEEGSRHHK